MSNRFLLSAAAGLALLGTGCARETRTSTPSTPTSTTAASTASDATATRARTPAEPEAAAAPRTANESTAARTRTETSAAAAAEKTMPGANSLTGCLAKGDTADSYMLTPESGAAMKVSGSADLAKHVGHKVTLTGSDSSGTFMVTKIQHLSPTCTAAK